MIPYKNESSSGVIYLTEAEDKVEFGSYTVDRKNKLTKEMFDIDTVKTCISELDRITDIIFLKSDMYKMNLVYVVADEEEYIILYYYSMLAEEYQGMEAGQFHISSFMKWLSTDFTNHPNFLSKEEEKRLAESGANYFFGGGVTYIEKKQNDTTAYDNHHNFHIDCFRTYCIFKIER